MRKILLSCFLVSLFSCLPAWSQTKLTAEQQKEIVAKIDKSASAMTQMQCEFTQTKSMKLLSKEMQSKGVMYLKKPSKLRWQYTSPYDYTFIMNGDKVQIKSTKSTKNIDVQGNKIFRQITNIILNSVTGGTLKNSSDFTVEVYKTDAGYYDKYDKCDSDDLKRLFKARAVSCHGLVIYRIKVITNVIEAVHVFLLGAFLIYVSAVGTFGIRFFYFRSAVCTKPWGRFF